MRAIILLCLLVLPAFAQAQTAGQTTGPAPVPLPTWFVEIDTAKKGEVARADFLKYRMKSFDELDANKDGKVSLEEFLKLNAEYAKTWPNITIKRDPPADAKEWEGKPDKIKLFDPEPGEGD